MTSKSVGQQHYYGGKLGGITELLGQFPEHYTQDIVRGMANLYNSFYDKLLPKEKEEIDSIEYYSTYESSKDSEETLKEDYNKVSDLIESYKSGYNSEESVRGRCVNMPLSLEVRLYEREKKQLELEDELQEIQNQLDKLNVDPEMTQHDKNTLLFH